MNNMSETVYDYELIEDPGHSWLKVPIADVIRLKIMDKITEYSPIKGEYIYLEEDCDLYTFYVALRSMNGKLTTQIVTQVNDFQNYLRQQR